ncbi:MAG: hypothetical protein KGH59_00445 [Candidatus Micrarchaeota archaeon]|nr:hypothetical protein [Candidatus Micrarchaeota archaeon]MDE1804242.1 hypothetical protein [Candidatus Micrarchaeota archaeon]MDE1846986.1 hypothetical protein [Candidatus Micrarchaeota archaeon]
MLNEQYRDGKTYVFQDAGSNVYEIEDSIIDVVQANPTISKFVLIVHGAFDINHPEEKCAACREVFDVLNEEKKLGIMGGDTKEVWLDGKPVAKSIMDLLVKPFRGTEYQDFVAVEKQNRIIQETRLREVLKKIGREDIEVEPIEMPTSQARPAYNEHRGEHYEKRAVSTDKVNSPNYQLICAEGRSLPASEDLIRSKGKTELVVFNNGSPKNRVPA